MKKVLEKILIVGMSIIPLLNAGEGEMKLPPIWAGTVNTSEVSDASLRLTESATLMASPSEVFSHLSHHDNWTSLISSIQEMKVNGSGKKSSTRSLVLADGTSVSEKIVAFDRPSLKRPGTFAWSITKENPLGLKGHLGVLSVNSISEGISKVTFYQIFDHDNVKGISPVIKAGMRELLSNLVYKFGGSFRGSTDSTNGLLLFQSRIVKKSVSDSWNVIGVQWGDVHKWASMISHSSVKENGRTEVGAIRSCDVPGAPGFKETLLSYDEKEYKLAYQVLEGIPPFMTKAVGTWDLDRISDTRTRVSIKVESRIAPEAPPGALAMVQSQFGMAVEIAADDFVYYLENGAPLNRKSAMK